MTLLRKAAIGLALCGAAVAGYLACVQLNLIHGAWDPVFGAASSHHVLHSRFAEALPFPDALAGAIVYAVEAGLAIVVSRSTQQTWRVLYVIVVLGMAAGGLALLGLQAAFIHHFCLLCLISAAISWVIAVIVAADAMTSRADERSMRQDVSSSNQSGRTHVQDAAPPNRREQQDIRL